MARIIRRLLGLVLLAALVLPVALWAMGVIVLPPRYDPFAPLDLAEEPGLLTRFKLGRVEGDPALCRAALATGDLVQTPVPDRQEGAGCGLAGAVRLARAGASSLATPVLASCPLAAAWGLFERNALQQAARRHLGQEVARVVHLGTYACRNINHADTGRRSEHATANAIDIGVFVLADGTRIGIEADWRGSPARAAFLREVRDGACRFFDVVLSPDYNALHRDHLHLDMGRSRACR